MKPLFQHSQVTAWLDLASLWHVGITLGLVQGTCVSSAPPLYCVFSGLLVLYGDAPYPFLQFQNGEQSGLPPLSLSECDVTLAVVGELLFVVPQGLPLPIVSVPLCLKPCMALKKGLC